MNFKTLIIEYRALLDKEVNVMNQKTNAHFAADWQLDQRTKALVDMNLFNAAAVRLQMEHSV